MPVWVAMRAKSEYGSPVASITTEPAGTARSIHAMVSASPGLRFSNGPNASNESGPSFWRMREIVAFSGYITDTTTAAAITARNVARRRPPASHARPANTAAPIARRGQAWW